MGIPIRLERFLSIKRGDGLKNPIPDTELSVFVVFTSVSRTLKALRKACEIAKPVGADIVVVAAQVVPFPLPLDEAPVPKEFIIRRFEKMASEFHEKTRAIACLCRDPMEAFKSILDRDCPVMIGVRKGWLPTRDKRLARKLRRTGYDVIPVETE